MLQLNLDFSKPRIAQGKKTERITITCSTEFKSVVDLICRLTGSSPSEIGQRYFISGMQTDLGNVFMAEPHLEKTLAQLMRKS
jgi:hypothetical protein